MACAGSSPSPSPASRTRTRPLPSVEPKTPPPLADVAARLGVPVRYAAGNGSAFGFYSLRENAIVLHTHDADVFFHELAHAAHRLVRGELKGGQDPTQEIVAEFSAAVLERLYLPESQQKLRSHVEYIAKYARVKGRDEAAKKCLSLLAEVEKVLDVILNAPEAAPACGVAVAA